LASPIYWPRHGESCCCFSISIIIRALLEPSLYTVKAVFILDNDGNRLLSKYYDPELYPSMKEQKTFERNVFNKTHKADNEIAFLEGMTIVYKSSIDLFFYVVGSAQENELMLMSVLNCLFDSTSHILRKNVERRCLLENMEGVFLVVDEIIDGGVILESDPQQVLQKVNYRVRFLSVIPQNLLYQYNHWKFKQKTSVLDCRNTNQCRCLV
uniref:Coatomer subunit zeta n=1 Tax=Haplochromis burtoni TaxID=8153 RepID=A0A3Q2XAQ4_HAPBU